MSATNSRCKGVDIHDSPHALKSLVPDYLARTQPSRHVPAVTEAAVKKIHVKFLVSLKQVWFVLILAECLSRTVSIMPLTLCKIVGSTCTGQLGSRQSVILSNEIAA
jgi:hypothetical protein